MATFRDSNLENIYALFGVNFVHPKSGCVKFRTFRMSGFYSVKLKKKIKYKYLLFKNLLFVVVNGTFITYTRYIHTPEKPLHATSE